MSRNSSILATLFFLATVGRAEAKPVTITWVAGNAALQTEQSIRKGFDDYLRQHQITDWKVDYLDSAGAAEKVANNIQDAVTRKSDFIFVTVADLRASNSALESAARAKVPVYSADSGWIPGDISDVTTNNWQMSSEVSLALINKLHSKGSIVFFTADALKPVRERTDTMKAILREYPTIKIIATHDIDMSNFYQDTLNAMSDIAQRFGNKIDGVWAPWDEPALAAITALNSAHLHVPVTGMDGAKAALEMICKPDSNFLATGRQQFDVWGATLADHVYQVVEKGRSPDAVAPDEITYLPAKLFTAKDCHSS